MLSGLLLTPIMEFAYLKWKNIDEAGVKDRCYRLRYNKKQLLIDRLVVLCAGLGWLALRWPGVVVGTCYAVFTGAFYNVSIFLLDMQFGMVFEFVFIGSGSRKWES